MLANDRGIGSEGLEQGGPSLGNDYSRKDLGLRDAGDALTTPNTTGLNKDDQDTLSMDNESSRNLSSSTADLGANSDLETDDLEDDLDDLDDDDDLLDLDEDDDDDDVELDKGL